MTGKEELQKAENSLRKGERCFEKEHIAFFQV